MIKIAHLFYDTLDLYGENGNIKALKYALDKNQIPYEITNITFEDKIDFLKYDFIYIGSGRPLYLEKAKSILKEYKLEIEKYLELNKILLVTGNALSIFEFLGKYTIINIPDFLVNNITATTSLCNGTIKSFQNTEYLIKDNDHIIFNLNSSVGNNLTPFEGYKYRNFYVTSLIGPILALNPELLNYFIELLKANKN